MTHALPPDDDQEPEPGPEVASEAVPGTADPLLLQAQRIGDLPLQERPGALQHLNEALVAELNALEEV